MGREFTDRDMDIFNKLAPEAGGNNISQMGHPYPFILRPISHRFAESGEDFRNRLEKLDRADVEYLADLAIEGKEDVRGLEDEDMDSFFSVLEGFSPEKLEELKDKLGMI
ncbi:hypothetical protein [Methanohalophilus mahii]|uniref:Uncharacterized protein n=1 Tax=Methanohalophilus mahii (strain ATCC 35705 / DSM 5219 / SLP) TaxID=547558 RepID=D5E9C6_METMS|nr:hypothetical protein [Methanohalophilus mahii]ADE35777.1 hypothetical protein Mmah_0244 [Methanohalophilus mahii DSM 5219]